MIHVHFELADRIDLWAPFKGCETVQEKVRVVNNACSSKCDITHQELLISGFISASNTLSSQNSQFE